MATPGFDAHPQDVPPAYPVPPVAASKRRPGCLVAVVVVGLGVLACVAAVAAGAWYLWKRNIANEAVGQCFPDSADSPLDIEHGTVSCTHPDALWRITKVVPGRHNGNVIGTCGPQADALVYLETEDKSYCLESLR